VKEVRKSIQDLNEEFSNMDEKISKNIQILKKKRNLKVNIVEGVVQVVRDSA
jgi:hypothetical protein